MIYVDLADRKEREQFSKKAAKYFEKSPEKQLYTGGSIEANGLMAAKWGESEGENHSVIVFRTADADVEMYRGIVKTG